MFVQNGWKVVGLHNAGSDFMPKLNRSFYAANDLDSVNPGLPDIGVEWFITPCENNDLKP